MSVFTILVSFLVGRTVYLFGKKVAVTKFFLGLLSLCLCLYLSTLPMLDKDKDRTFAFVFVFVFVFVLCLCFRLYLCLLSCNTQPSKARPPPSLQDTYKMKYPDSRHVSKGCVSKKIEKPHTILLTDFMKWDVDFRATLFQLKRKGTRSHREGVANRKKNTSTLSSIHPCLTCLPTSKHCTTIR